MEANCRRKSVERAQCVCEPPSGWVDGGGGGGGEGVGQSIVVKPPPLTGFLGEQAHALTDVPLSQIESRCVCYRQESWRKKK